MMPSETRAQRKAVNVGHSDDKTIADHVQVMQAGESYLGWLFRVRFTRLLDALEQDAARHSATDPEWRKVSACIEDMRAEIPSLVQNANRVEAILAGTYPRELPTRSKPRPGALHRRQSKPGSPRKQARGQSS